jgi:hypothetical protein
MPLQRTSKLQKKPSDIKREYPALKGIFQPFELGGETRLIPSAVKFCKAGHFKKNFFYDTIPREELKTN